MSNPLAAYVEKYILNPEGKAISNLEDEGNEETRPTVFGRIEGDEGAQKNVQSTSKLRIQNAELILDRDSRYKGEKASRQDISSVENGYQPELAKYFTLNDENADLEEEEGEEEDDQTEEEEENTDKEERESDEEDDSKKDFKVPSKKSGTKNNLDKTHKNDMDDLFLQMGEEIESKEEIDNDENSEDDEEDNEEEEEETENEEENTENEENINDDKSNSESEIESDSYDEDGKRSTGRESKEGAVRTFSLEGSKQAIRGQAVKNQSTIFDSLFEARIILQKILTIANQLPQHDKYDEFLQSQNYPQYKEKLLIARKVMKKLVAKILDTQEVLIKNNPETKHLASSIEGKCSSLEVNGNEENLSKMAESRGAKRKVEVFEATLRKRHKAMAPYREEVLNKWHEKSKARRVPSSHKSFAGFETNPCVLIKLLLTAKDDLVKKTQVVGVTRGNVLRVLGKPEVVQDPSDLMEKYDPEIFDDSDFYSRMLEDVLKWKMSSSSDVTDHSRKWMDVQRLRKKAKKVVDTKASKGRKLRYEVFAKLQQFLAPSKHSLMEDSAMNRLFASLFGQTPENKEKY